MYTPKLQREELAEVLLAVVKALRIAESKFQSAASMVTDSRIREALLDRALAWAKAARELSAVAAIERVAANMAHASVRVARACLPGDPAPLVECERCEEAVALRYRDALDYRLPAEVERLLIRQYDDLLDHYGKLHRLIAEYANASRMGGAPA